MLFVNKIRDNKLTQTLETNTETTLLNTEKAES